MVEMALITPLIILLILGIAEFGWFIYSSSELGNAIRLGTEYASKSPPTTISSADDSTTDMCARLIKTNIKQHAFMHPLADADIQILYPDSARQLREIGVPVEIRLSYNGPWLTPLGNTLFGNRMPLSFTSRRSIVNTDPLEGYKDGCIK